MQIKETSSPNHSPRPDDVVAPDMLILHYTGLPTLQESLARLCDPSADVSAHYLISEEGDVHALVPEDRRAWHAGVSYWRGATDINSRSIGIELQNPGHEFGHRAFPAPQMASLVELSLEILGRYPIPARHVLGHSDVSPDRKQDPGELFDWAGLAADGIGLWPQSEARLNNSAQGTQMTQNSGTVEKSDEETAAELTQSRRKAREAKDKTLEKGPVETSDEGAIVLTSDTRFLLQPIQLTREIATLQTLLEEFGYAPHAKPGVLDEVGKRQLVAFQRHFQPWNLSGDADQETLRILEALLAMA